MIFGIIRYPASITHDDLYFALSDIMEQHVRMLWYDDTSLQNADALLLPAPGDFDAAVAELKHSSLFRQVLSFVEKGGFLLGAGDAFRLLCHFGLLPGHFLSNPNGRYLSKNLFVKVDNRNSRVSALHNHHFPLHLPVATAFGAYRAEKAEVETMQQQRQIIFRFSDQEGLITPEANPLDSLDNIAGISNPQRTVFGLIPHPERATDDELGNTDGYVIFDSVIHIIGRSISRNLV